MIDALLGTGVSRPVTGKMAELMSQVQAALKERKKHFDAFPANDVSKELLGSVVVQRPYQRACYEELIEPLQAQGRDDLAQAIRRILFKCRVKRMLKGIDKRLCGGKLLALKKAVFNKT